MTLREWVTSRVGIDGTRAELEAFETGLLEGWQHAEQHAGFAPPINADVDAAIWSAGFKFWRTLTHGGVPDHAE